MTVVEIDRTGPLLDTGYGWPRYPSEMADEYGVAVKSWMDVRTPEQVEADEWAVQQWWRHWTIAFTTEDPVLRLAAYDEWDQAQAFLWGLFAPSELHARRLALHMVDPMQMFIRRDEERCYRLAESVLRGWTARG